MMTIGFRRHHRFIVRLPEVTLAAVSREPFQLPLIILDNSSRYTFHTNRNTIAFSRPVRGNFPTEKIVNHSKKRFTALQRLTRKWRGCGRTLRTQNRSFGRKIIAKCAKINVIVISCSKISFEMWLPPLSASLHFHFGTFRNCAASNSLSFSAIVRGHG